MNAAASVVEVRVPDMGNFKDVAVIDVLVKPGDSIAIDTPLVTLESDKATMDVPSTAVGVVEKVHTSKGGTVNTGDLIATVRADGAPRARGPVQAMPARHQHPPSHLRPPPHRPGPLRRLRSSPLPVRRRRQHAARCSRPARCSVCRPPIAVISHRSMSRVSHGRTRVPRCVVSRASSA